MFESEKLLWIYNASIRFTESRNQIRRVRKGSVLYKYDSQEKNAINVLADTADMVSIDIKENKDSQVLCECSNMSLGQNRK